MNISTSENRKKDKGLLAAIERIGNKIPDPLVFFLYLILIVLVASAIMSAIGITDVNPATDKKVEVFNLLSIKGITMMLSNMTKNFAGFSVMTMTLTCMLGMAIADKAGLFESVLRKITLSSKGSDAKIMLVFITLAVLSDITNGSGFVIIPILGAIVWANMGRNPIVGMVCGYGSIAGAFAANFMLGTTDILCAGFTQSAAQVLDPSFTASASMGWYFQSFSALILIPTAYFVTVKFVEPRMGKLDSSYSVNHEQTEMPNEGRALKWAGVALLIFVAIVVAMCVPASGIMRDPETGSLVSNNSGLMNSLVFYIALFFFIPGVVFGKMTGRFTNIKDVIDAMCDGIASMSRFIVLSFVMAQFMQYFSWSNIGTLVAIKGANALKASGLPIIVICIIFILFCGILNLFIGSASAKWGVLAPIFVPMFMMMKYNPAVIQMCYRIGDAISNPITPAFAYIAMLLAQAKKYDDKIGFGTLIASLMPYTVAFSIVLIVQFICWYVFNIPFGPGQTLLLP